MASHSARPGSHASGGCTHNRATNRPPHSGGDQPDRGAQSRQSLPLEVAVSNPVPGHTVKTPFHRRGPKWRTCGIKNAGTKQQTGLHTGVDIPAILGTPVVAARAGETKHVHFGHAFGTKQLVVLCDDGTEDFYAHMSARTAGGRKVKAGDKIGEVGNSSSFTIGFHLHFERHKEHADNWSCAIVVNPEPSLRAGAESAAAAAVGPIRRVLLSELRFGETGLELRPTAPEGAEQTPVARRPQDLAHGQLPRRHRSGRTSLPRAARLRRRRRQEILRGAIAGGTPVQ